jgi:hypothetical protein
MAGQEQLGVERGQDVEAGSCLARVGVEYVWRKLRIGVAKASPVKSVLLSAR